MSWHFLQGQEEGSWEENSLDGAPYALLSVMPTRRRFYAKDKMMGYSHRSLCGLTFAIDIFYISA